MPVTPFHLGPAVVIKAACPTWFSLGTFALVQVVMDMETVWNILAGHYPIHGPVHTLPGSVLVALALTAPAKGGLSRLYAAIRLRKAASDRTPRWALALLGEVSWRAASIGGLVGAVSHVLLDAVIHDEVRPLAPVALWNPLFVPGSFVAVHVLCAAVGGVGLLIWLARARRAALIIGGCPNEAHSKGGPGCDD